METELNKQDVLRILEKESSYLQEHYGIARIALYGSFAQDTATETSDVDLLVELSRPLGFEFVALAEHLESILGRKVDLSTFATLRQSLENPRYQSIALNIQRTLTDVHA
jgi:predicted nucleotidyltransferase